MKAAPGNTPFTADNLDSTKLVSLLALAAGAVAMPQTGQADIIVTDLSGSPVNIGFLGNSSYMINNLPGTARVGFQFGRHGTASITSSRYIFASQVAGYVRLKTNGLLAVHVAAGMNWNNVAGGELPVATIASAYYSRHAPNGFSHDYLLFKFQDSTQTNAVRYGWVDVSLSNGNLNSTEGPELTIWRYAYDTTGAALGAGQVPEPGSVSLLALGALAFGARGVRSWKRNRAQ